MVRRLMADIDPGGAEVRFPGRRRQPKQRGHLTDTGVYYEIHLTATRSSISKLCAWDLLVLTSMVLDAIPAVK